MKRLNKDDLLAHSVLVFAAMMVVHICNLGFQMVVSRLLSPVEYTLLAVFLAALAIIQRPLSTLRTGVCHYSSLLQNEGRSGDVRRLLKKWMSLALMASLVLGGLVIFFSQPLTRFFHLQRSEPILITGLVLPALFCLPVINGSIQGLQMFAWSSAASIVGALVRITMGAGLLWFVYPACGWAMLGHGLGLYSSLAVLLLVYFLFLRGQTESAQKLPSMRLYLSQSFVILMAYTVLMTADVVLVKHLFPEDTQFAFAATLGRLVVFIAMAVAVAMFPKVVSTGRATAAQRKVFIRALLYTALCSLPALLVCWLFPRLLLRLVFGVHNAQDSTVLYVQAMSLAMSISSILNIVVQYGLAQRRFNALLLPVAGSAAAYLAAVIFCPGSVLHVVWFACLANAAALIGALAALLRTKSSGAADERDGIE
jgi:O-antigen/teichoic acid export membrane protein